MSDSLQPHGMQPARLPCPSPTPGACSNSCPTSRWCHPAISSSVAPFSSHIQSFPPSIRVFSNDSVLHIRWPKYWSFSFSISPSNEYSGLISFRIDWFDILAVQGTLKSLLQHHSSKPSIIRLSAFFMVQLSHPFMTGKTIALTIWTFVAKVVSLLFNMLSRLVIAFIPRSRHLLISCLQSFKTSGSFLVSQLFTSRGQSIGASVLASVLPMNIQDWFPLGLSSLISLLSEELSRVFSSTTIQKHQFLGAQPSLSCSYHTQN